MSFFAFLKRIFSYEKYMTDVIAQRVEEVAACLDANYHPKSEPEPIIAKKTDTHPTPYPAPITPKEPVKTGEKCETVVRYSITANIPHSPEVRTEVERRLDLLMGAENSRKILQSMQLAKIQTFVEYLRYHIYRQRLTGPQVYHAAQIDKRLYSKIISNTHYNPSRETAIALAFATRLGLNEAKTLLSRAGYTLSETNRRDLILICFFQNKRWNLIEINSVLDALDEAPIGRG